MKTKHVHSFAMITLFVTALFFISTSFSQDISPGESRHENENLKAPADSQAIATPANDPNRLSGNSVFGTIDFGYSNLGMIGRSEIYLRQGNEFVKAGYYKSHICFLDGHKGEHFHGEKSSENHVTVQTFSVSMGFISHRNIFLSGGIAYSHFHYEHTQPMHDIISAQTVWATIINKNWGETVLHDQNTHVVGIPLEAKWMINPAGFAGISLGAMVYLNTEQTIYAAQLGLRLGKVDRKKL